MVEIIIAVILQVATIIGGVSTEKELADQKAKDEKAKKEMMIKTDGGTGNWETNSK
ncbi:hypothetical protein [Pontibacter fetidus]|uniref:Uncharacterized protein n=1 Tax=Pontibacter fetidus TaxID=2700082 RepID=A0A6B2H938_9BACT|nr:hypothetical protein [Pontibacter fetidus]NDK55992.1 hypothetical protein [Pontibacter fetidus]